MVVNYESGEPRIAVHLRPRCPLIGARRWQGKDNINRGARTELVPSSGGISFVAPLGLVVLVLVSMCMYLRAETGSAEE